jgi:transcriptional regulator with XRE-family HTH domain
MQIHEVLKKTREALGKTQEEIAAAVNMKRQELQRYEHGGGLPQTKLREISKLLHIDPEYAVGKASYPFQSDELIKMVAKEGWTFENTLQPLSMVANFNQRIKLIHIVAPDELLKKLYKMLGLPWIFALIFMDDVGNIFLLRGKKDNDLINLSISFPQYLIKVIKETNCSFFVGQKKADKKLLDKIRNWNVTKKDMRRIFDEVNLMEVDPPETEEERKQLKYQRSQGMKAFSNAETFVMKNIRETMHL